ncbi:MAG: gliding motility protein GldN [Chitinophagaceae bacterium]|nr:gliding motility protein GldN [Chitinophagaceae bacterium]
MKSRIIKICLLAAVMTVGFVDADAQRVSRKRNTQQPTSNQPQQDQNQPQNNNRQPSGYNPYGNIPIEVDKTSAYSGDSVKKSLRPDAAFDKGYVNERTPLPYEHLRWDDALYTERVWRELDLREKMNQPFRYASEDDNGSQKFVEILLKAVRSGEVTAFADDRFTTPLSMQDINQVTAGGEPDTTAVRDVTDPNKIVKFVVTQTAFDPDAILKLRVKEDWVFDREASRMFVRILGISPVKTVYNPNGTERGTTPLFWIYYPDIRPILAKYEVYNPKNMGDGRMTWEELWESRMFSSYITKSTLDNPFNKTIKSVVKDPILTLLEGENIKERIFNYEQDLWSY